MSFLGRDTFFFSKKEYNGLIFPPPPLTAIAKGAILGHSPPRGNKKMVTW